VVSQTGIQEARPRAVGVAHIWSADRERKNHVLERRDHPGIDVKTDVGRNLVDVMGIAQIVQRSDRVRCKEKVDLRSFFLNAPNQIHRGCSAVGMSDND
jgi:hypothetical protein